MFDCHRFYKFIYMDFSASTSIFSFTKMKNNKILNIQRQTHVFIHIQSVSFVKQIKLLTIDWRAHRAHSTRETLCHRYVRVHRQQNNKKFNEFVSLVAVILMKRLQKSRLANKRNAEYRKLFEKIKSFTCFFFESKISIFIERF